MKTSIRRLEGQVEGYELTITAESEIEAIALDRWHGQAKETNLEFVLPIECIEIVIPPYER